MIVFQGRIIFEYQAKLLKKKIAKFKYYESSNQYHIPSLDCCEECLFQTISFATVCHGLRNGIKLAESSILMVLYEISPITNASLDFEEQDPDYVCSLFRPRIFQSLYYFDLGSTHADPKICAWCTLPLLASAFIYEIYYMNMVTMIYGISFYPTHSHLHNIYI